MTTLLDLAQANRRTDASTGVVFGASNDTTSVRYGVTIEDGYEEGGEWVCSVLLDGATNSGSVYILNGGETYETASDTGDGTIIARSDVKLERGYRVTVVLQGNVYKVIAIGNLAAEVSDLADAVEENGSFITDADNADLSKDYEIKYRALSPVGEWHRKVTDSIGGVRYDIAGIYGDVGARHPEFITPFLDAHAQAVTITPKESQDLNDLKARTVTLDPVAILDAAYPWEWGSGERYKNNLMASSIYKDGTPLLYDEAAFKSDGTYTITRRYGFASLYGNEWELWNNQAGDVLMRTPVDFPGIARRCVFNLYPYIDESSYLISPWASPFELVYAETDGQGYLYRFVDPENLPSYGNWEYDVGSSTGARGDIQKICDFWTQEFVNGGTQSLSGVIDMWCIWYPLETPIIQNGTWDATQPGAGEVSIEIADGIHAISVNAYTDNAQGRKISELDSRLANIEAGSMTNALTLTIESQSGSTDTTQTYTYDGTADVDVKVERIQSQNIIAAVNLVS